MTRVKRGIITKKRHKRLLKQAKGFWGQRNNIFRRAKETLMRAWAYAFAGRKMKKRDFRSLFIVRIGAAARKNNLTYGRFMHGLKSAGVILNRKMLSQIAIFDEPGFSKITEISKKAV